jgi:hypothetical protein
LMHEMSSDVVATLALARIIHRPCISVPGVSTMIQAV